MLSFTENFAIYFTVTAVVLLPTFAYHVKRTSTEEKLNRQKRQTYPHYNYNSPDLKTIDGFLNNLVVLLNNDRIETLKSNNFHPRYTLTLPNNLFEPGDYHINGISIASNDAKFISLEQKPIEERTTIAEKLKGYAGNDDEEVQSQSYAKSVADATSYKFGEKLSVKAGFKIKVVSVDVTAELSAEQMFTKTTTHTITAPIQKTKVKANHEKEIKYILYEETSTSIGVLRAKIDPTLKINTFFEKIPSDLRFYYQQFMSLKELVEKIKNKGHSHLFQSGSILYEEGNDLFLNIPTEVSTTSHRLIVEFGDNIPRH